MSKGRLAERVDAVIGVDTHKQAHMISIVDPTGGERGHHRTDASLFGYQRMLTFVHKHAPGTRLWAVEGAGSYGSGLTNYLLEQGEEVVEVDRPRRPARRSGAKSDQLDATRAAREVLSRKHLTQPRKRGDREALRVLVRARNAAIDAKTTAVQQLEAFIVTAPIALRNHLQKHTSDKLLERCARLRVKSDMSREYRMTIKAIRSTARRAQALDAEAEDLKEEIQLLIKELAPQLLAQYGIGPISAAEILIAWSHQGRIRSESAFAMLAGAAPIPASSGKITRHRLNRSGDRHLNHALHTIVMHRMNRHQETKTYVERRTQEGKTEREIRRCLKRHLARRLYKLLENQPIEA